MVASITNIQRSPTVTIYCPPPEEHLQYARWMSGYIDDYEPNGVIPVVVWYGDNITAMVGFSKPHFNRVEMCWASDNAKWATRANLLTLMSPPFIKWGMEGITATTNKNNKRVRKILEGMGWKREGTLRNAGGNGQNVMIYGLLRHEFLDLAKRWKPADYDSIVRNVEVARNG